MVRRYSIGRFMGPWLAYAALSGLAVGFVLGAIVTICGLIAGFFAVFGAGSIGTFIRQIAKAFPEYALFVLVAIAVGFFAGFLNGLLSALVGGKAGIWWSFGFFCGITFFVMPVNGSAISYFPVFVVGAMGALFPQHYLSQKPLRYEREQTLRKWLHNSWLVEPPQLARICGIFLPILLYAAFEISQVSPIFLDNKNYAARLGTIATWQNSRRLWVWSSRPSAPRAMCQANLKQIMLGVMQYTQDYDGFYPPKLTDPAHGVAFAVYPYVKTTQIFQCPAEFYRAGNEEFKSGDFTDYWFNARLCNLDDAKVMGQSFTVAFGDGNTGMGEANSAYMLSGLPTPFAPAMRHWGGANYVFADGHVKWMMPTAISNSARQGGYSFVPQIQAGPQKK